MKTEDIVAIRDRKRERLEALLRETALLQDEVTILDKAIGIAQRELTVTEEASEAVSASGRSLIERIREIVNGLTPPISTGLVRERLQEVDPDLHSKAHRTSVAGTMRRMAEGGELIVVQAGGPGREATYRLPTPEDAKPRSEDRADNQMAFEGEREPVESAR